jgi:Cu(I)/Ag(I) efflux system membrane fusion protein
LFIYPYLDIKTRTAKLRLEFANPDMELKPGMYANIYLTPRIAEDSLVVPLEAVIDTGMRKVVFVALGNGRFQARNVRLGVQGNQNEYQVLDGLSEGEEIVLSAQFMLDSESRLREAVQKMLEAQEKAPAEHTPTELPTPAPAKPEMQAHTGHDAGPAVPQESELPSTDAPSDHSAHGMSN